MDTRLLKSALFPLLPKESRILFKSVYHRKEEYFLSSFHFVIVIIAMWMLVHRKEMRIDVVKDDVYSPLCVPPANKLLTKFVLCESFFRLLALVLELCEGAPQRKTLGALSSSSIYVSATS
jgi:hypothetical protein